MRRFWEKDTFRKAKACVQDNYERRNHSEWTEDEDDEVEEEKKQLQLVRVYDNLIWIDRVKISNDNRKKSVKHLRRSDNDTVEEGEEMEWWWMLLFKTVMKIQKRKKKEERRKKNVE